MKKILGSIRSSTKELGNITALAVSGMLTALNVVLDFFTVAISNILEIHFSFLTIAAAGMLYGPVAGGIMGAVGDIIKYFVRPAGPFFPGFTLNAFLTGFIYGLVLYRHKITLGRVIAAQAIVVIVINFLLNSTWLSIMYGKAFVAVLAARVVSNLILFPVHVAILYFILKAVSRISVTARAKC